MTKSSRSYKPSNTAACYAVRNRRYRSLPKARVVLNLGCGSGAFCRYWPYARDAIVINVDYGKDYHAGWPAWGLKHKGWNGFKRICSNQWNWITMDRDIRDLQGFSSDMFDLVIVGEVIEHITVADAHLALEEWYRILRNRGTLQIDTPNVEYPVKDYSTSHEHEYTETELKTVVGSHGFVLESFEHLAESFAFWGVWKKV